MNPVWLRAGAIAGALVSFVCSVLWTLERRHAGDLGGVVALRAMSLLLLAGAQSRGRTWFRRWSPPCRPHG